MLMTIFSGYGIILKQENNFSDRVNDLVSKRKKVPMLTPVEFDSKMVETRKSISFVFLPNICVGFFKFERYLLIR